MQWLILTIKILVLIILITIGLLIYFQQGLVYLPDYGSGQNISQNPVGYRRPEQANIYSYQNITILTQDNLKLHGWHLKYPYPQRIIIFFHGNAGNIGIRLKYLSSIIKQTHSNIIIVSYRGYSQNEGSPNEQGLKKDGLAILQRSLNISKSLGLPLYLFGRSLGGAVAIHTAGISNYSAQIKGLIVQNTFTSTTEVLTFRLGPILGNFMQPFLSVINFNKWHSKENIKNVKCPVFFIKSKEDKIVPPFMSQLLRQSYMEGNSQGKTALYSVERAGHFDAWLWNTSQFYTIMRQFFKNTEISLI